MKITAIKNKDMVMSELNHEIKSAEQYLKWFSDKLIESEATLFNAQEKMKSINHHIENPLLYISINYIIEKPPAIRMDNFFYNLSTKKDFEIQVDDVLGTVIFYQDDKLVFEELMSKSEDLPLKCLTYIKNEVEKDLNSWWTRRRLKKYINEHIFEKLKKDNPLSLKRLKIRYNPFKIVTLDKACLPIVLTCGRTEFDLSGIPNPHITEVYDKEFIAAIENKILNVKLKSKKNKEQKTNIAPRKRL